jgi:hypothetical protein
VAFTDLPRTTLDHSGSVTGVLPPSVRAPTAGPTPVVGADVMVPEAGGITMVVLGWDKPSEDCSAVTDAGATS